MNKKNKQVKRTSALCGVLLAMLTGCTPSEPVSPLFGPVSERVIVYILIVLVVYLIWNLASNRSTSEKNSSKIDLEHIDSRLNAIENDIYHIKSKLKGQDHDEQ